MPAWRFLLLGLGGVRAGVGATHLRQSRSAFNSYWGNAVSQAGAHNRDQHRRRADDAVFPGQLHLTDVRTTAPISMRISGAPIHSLQE